MPGCPAEAVAQAGPQPLQRSVLRLTLLEGVSMRKAAERLARLRVELVAEQRPASEGEHDQR